MLFKEFVQYLHFLIKDLVVFGLLLKLVSERATSIGKADDTGSHDENAKNLLSEGRCGEIAVPDRCDCCNGEVEACQVEV